MSRTAGLRRRVLSTLASAVPTLFVVLLIGFAVTRLAPGDPITMLAGEHAPPEYADQIRAKYGLDRPIPEQFLKYLATLATGDFGFSYASQQPVLTLIAERTPATLILVGAAILLALLIGIGTAVIATRWPGSLTDTVMSTAATLGYAIPVFWLGQILIYAFAVKLDLFPAGGMQDLRAPSEGIERLLDLLHHLALPTLNLGIIYAGLIGRLAHAEMIEVQAQDFVLAAHAKGVAPWTVQLRHVLRNALAPIVTVTGILLGTMFAGAIFTETIFGWPGLGRLLYDALFSRDYPTITAIFVLTSVTLVIVNFLVDLAYMAIDPRVRA